MVCRLCLLVALFFCLPRLAAAACPTCHAKIEQAAGWAHTYADWEESIHAFNEITCTSCHGGDNGAPEAAKAHAGIRFRGQAAAGDPAVRLTVVQLCSGCHQDTFHGYRVSPHFKALSAGRKAADCATCHGAVGGHVLNAGTITATCRQCHTDTAAGNTVEVAQTMLEFTHRIRMALVFPEPGHQLTGDKRARVEEAISAAMAAWHEFNLESLGQALVHGTGVLDQ
ncbi:MAG: hypothetical protein COW73_05465 [Nitrospirae bacterium CG18_big_fil_WC_8_21_14_2_50_70_55]|nr:hypothetical protein [Deltaproteobacteria bacterium]OIP64442.1 MAG: hypothetical protein AUK30_06760 [Nitrospirae bacterium CG2_30_70_394]PIQ05579.1 MAG: hypothetical protein COW73_05465 [Nitrospirae bacterium CG18_big_fil_WC_8_21_14_2_50_70_55]PIU77448.1 MAG: hypothetical protein COS73_10550 [Nitrospirae bacterium CG06_land_8_20_14_3_00_70_43]PIW83477.1 MAG: hypothetical protein COZ96_03180 [Nitrospirae bacterium CG_4_8_14_3_um_filter_70_85]PIX82262.1 MAG: hypothetical protein COZ33_11630 